MNNYEKILTLSIEEMARRNVIRRYTNHDFGFWTDSFYTSDGTLFDTREDAEEYELEWLKREVNN